MFSFTSGHYHSANEKCNNLNLSPVYSPAPPSIIILHSLESLISSIRIP